jgi:hypothetical protein
MASSRTRARFGATIRRGGHVSDIVAEAQGRQDFSSALRARLEGIDGGFD